MIEIIILIVGIFVLSGIFWHSIFYQKEKKLLNRLQKMLDCAIDGELERTEISEEKYSALENSMKHYLDSSFLDRKNQQEQVLEDLHYGNAFLFVGIGCCELPIV